MKTLNLPDQIADELARTSEELSFMAKKPISQSMTVDMLIEVYRAHLSNSCALDAFRQQLQSLNIMAPEEFDKYWDGPAKPKKTEPKAKPKKSAKQA